jgi:hypothetical protein
MDIYFCDLCGARVTDVDLRGGHGIRRQYDVICATCLELGHGKEWLAKHQPRPRQAAAKPPVQLVAVAAGAAVPIGGVRSEPSIDVARDRARTADEDHPDETPAVAPRTLQADEPEETPASELEGDDEPGGAPQQEGNGYNLAAAASSFAAMGGSAKAAGVASADDLVDEAHDEHDAPTESVALGTKDAAAKDEIEEAASPFQAEAATAPSGKDETLPIDRAPLVPEKPKASTSSANTRKSSAKVSKNKMPKGSGRARSRNNNKNVLMMSGISLAILTMIMLIIISGHKSGPKDRTTIKVDLSENVKHSMSEARVAADSALKTLKMGDLKAAKAKILAIVPEIDHFAKEAEKQGWTDDEMGRYLEQISWPATNSRIRLLNDEIAKQGGGN